MTNNFVGGTLGLILRRSYGVLPYPEPAGPGQTPRPTDIQIEIGRRPEDTVPRMSDTIIFNSRRMQRAQRVQAARHVLVGAILAFGGIEAITSGRWTWADLVGTVGGAVLIIAFVLEMRHLRKAAGAHGGHAHHGIGWIDVFAAVVTAVEAWHLHHQGKHGLPYAYGFVALILLGVGLAHPRLSRLRRLILSDEGFDVRMGPWRRVCAPWSQVKSVTGDKLVVTVVLAGGLSHRFDFSGADNGAQVVDAFTRAARRPAVTEAGPGDG